MAATAMEVAARVVADWETAEAVRGVAVAAEVAVVMVTMAEGETAVATVAVVRARMMALVSAEVAMVVAVAVVTGGTRYHRSIWRSHKVALRLQTASAAPVSTYIETRPPSRLSPRSQRQARARGASLGSLSRRRW